MRMPGMLRSNEWLEFKIPPILLVAYITAMLSGTALLSVAPWFLFLFLSLFVGASYVSIINDITDMKEDLASGKSNRMARIKPTLRWIFPAFSLGFGILFLIYYSRDNLSFILYLASWIAFSLYSIPPVRLKKRGVWGVLADAGGSQLFPSLLMVSFISFQTGQPVNWTWFTIVACWSLSYGLRGIFWHQFHDKKNDLEVGLKTAVTSMTLSTEKRLTFVLMTAEILSLIAMIWYANILLPVVFLLFYLTYVLLLHKRMNLRIIAVRPAEHGAYHIFLSDYYQVLFPISVLSYMGWMNPWAFPVLLIHLLLFPNNLILMIRNSIQMARSYQLN